MGLCGEHDIHALSQAYPDMGWASCYSLFLQERQRGGFMAFLYGVLFLVCMGLIGVFNYRSTIRAARRLQQLYPDK